MVYMISCLPAARAQVAGPSLAPRRKKAWTTGVLRQLMARSSGRIPCKSTCSKIAPFSKRICRIQKNGQTFSDYLIQSKNTYTWTILGSEQVAARSNGVRPFLSTAFTLDPLSNSVTTAWRWPWMQAQLKAVNPSLSVFLTSAPVSTELQLSNCLQTECTLKS